MSRSSGQTGGAPAANRRGLDPAGQSAADSQPDAVTASRNAAAGSAPASSAAANVPTSRPKDPSSSTGASRTVASAETSGGGAPAATTMTSLAVANAAASTATARAPSASGSVKTMTDDCGRYRSASSISAASRAGRSAGFAGNTVGTGVSANPAERP